MGPGRWELFAGGCGVRQQLRLQRGLGKQREAQTCFPVEKGSASVPSAFWPLGFCPVFLQQLQLALDSKQQFVSCSRDALWIVRTSSLSHWFTEPQTVRFTIPVGTWIIEGVF